MRGFWRIGMRHDQRSPLEATCVHPPQRGDQRWRRDIRTVHGAELRHAWRRFDLDRRRRAHQLHAAFWLVDRNAHGLRGRRLPTANGTHRQHADVADAVGVHQRDPRHARAVHHHHRRHGLGPDAYDRHGEPDDARDAQYVHHCANRWLDLRDSGAIDGDQRNEHRPLHHQSSERTTDADQPEVPATGRGIDIHLDLCSICSSGKWPSPLDFVRNGG